MEQNCLFCSIAKKNVPADIVYENERTVAFLDIHPTNPGHTLIIPKTHYKNIYEMPVDTVTELMQTVHALAPNIKKALDADGINMMMNNDPAAGQVIFHAHIHLIPRFAGDGFAPWKGKPYTEGEAKEVQTKIKNTL